MLNFRFPVIGFILPGKRLYHLEFTGVCSSAVESYRGNVIKDKLFSGTKLSREAQVPPQTQHSLKKRQSV